MTLRFVAGLAVVIALAGCQGQLPLNVPGVTTPLVSDEDQIASVLADVHAGVQTRRIYKILAHVSRNYTDPEGRDYDALERALGELFKNYRQIRITRVPPRVIVQDDHARVIETFGVRAEPANPKNAPINMQGQVNIYLEKTSEGWQITEWSRVQ